MLGRRAQALHRAPEQLIAGGHTRGAIEVAFRRGGHAAFDAAQLFVGARPCVGISARPERADDAVAATAVGIGAAGRRGRRRRLLAATATGEGKARNERRESGTNE
jgi:hypothetical protein